MSNDPCSIALPCPSCRRGTSSLKQYRMLDFCVFFGLGAIHRAATFTACPSCMRRVIATRIALNLVLSNVLMIVLGPLYLIHLLRTLTPGHSDPIQREIEAALRRHRTAEETAASPAARSAA